VSILPNPKRVGYIIPIHEPLDGPLYMGSHIHQQYQISVIYAMQQLSLHITIPNVKLDVKQNPMYNNLFEQSYQQFH